MTLTTGAAVWGNVGGYVPTAKAGKTTSQNGTFQCSGSKLCCCYQLKTSRSELA